MGSSKKSKDKERSREERKKKKHRSRSRSKDRESRHRHKHKKKSRRRDHEHSRSRSPLSDISDLSDAPIASDERIMNTSAPPAPRISDHRKNLREEGELEEVPPSPPPSRGQKRKKEEDAVSEQSPNKKAKDDNLGGGWEEEGAGLSLSIAETNKIRAKLGLKPLKTDDAPGDASEKAKEKSKEEDPVVMQEPKVTKIVEDSHEFLHKPAQNIRDKLQVEKLREKIAVQREKRKQKEKLGKVKTLADSDSEEDSAVAWVKKSRKISKEREEAEKKAKQLEELDAEFGVGDLIEEEVAKDNRRAYGSKSLSGIKVQHHHTRFDEGTTVLTLADSEILANEEDTLVNVNIIDNEKAEKNIERKRNKDETEYEAPEMDEFGNMVQQDVLKKYDEELDGPKKSSFRIGRKGEAVLDDATLAGLGEKEKKMARLRKLQSLTREGGYQLVSEYQTAEEAAAVTFKKKKRKKKKKMLTADDLEPIEDNEVHHGSRNKRREGAAEGKGKNEGGVKSLRELMEEEEEEGGVKMEIEEKDNSYEGINDDHELQEALSMARKAKLSKKKELKVDQLKQIMDTTTSPEKGRGSKVALSDLLVGSESVTLNMTDEFCRTLGDIPTYGLSGNRAEEEKKGASLPEEEEKMEEEEEAQPVTGTWEEVGIEDTRVEIGETEAMPILDEEPDASVGVANALRLAIKKGYLEKESNTKKSNAGLQHLRAINYSIDDKAGDDDRRGGRGRDGDRYSGPLSDFKEKEGYKPSISLDYVDDEGRKLCPKEAFRYLSHKFHGKGSGKNKMEKRMKKWQEELLMKQMSSSDTPLQTLERQMEKQRALGTSYLMLSGSKHQETVNSDGKIRK